MANVVTLRTFSDELIFSVKGVKVDAVESHTCIYTRKNETIRLIDTIVSTMLTSHKLVITCKT